MRCWNVFLACSVAAFALGSISFGTQDGAAEAEAPRYSEKQPRPKDAKALFGLFAKMDGLEVTFEEEKHLQLLFEPLKSSGKLYFIRPGRLTRVVEKPKEQVVRIGPKKLTIHSGDDEEVVDLRQNKAVRAFVTSLVRVFSGDADGLAKFYDVEYVPSKKDERDWTLKLVPEEKALKTMVDTIRIEGRGTVVTRIEIVEPNGDRTVTKVTASNARREFTDEEREKLFGLPPLDKNAKKPARGDRKGA